MPKLKWPATGEELKAAGYVSMNRSTCKTCGAPIIWTHTPSGRTMPIETVGKDRFQTHFVTCPDAATHRGKK